MFFCVSSLNTNSSSSINSLLPLIGTLVGGSITFATTYFVTRHTQRFEKLKKTTEKKESCFWYYNEQIGKFLYGLHCDRPIDEIINQLLNSFSLIKLNNPSDNNQSDTNLLSVTELNDNCITVLTIECFFGRRHERFISSLQKFVKKTSGDATNNKAEVVKNLVLILKPRLFGWTNVKKYKDTPYYDKLIRNTLKSFVNKQRKYAKRAFLGKEAYHV
jgi:hypothetical protein